MPYSDRHITLVRVGRIVTACAYITLTSNFNQVSNVSVNETIPKGFRPSGDSRAVMRGTDKKVSTPYDTEALACVGCLSCANVCPTGEITYTQDADQRTIWNKAFDLVKCHSCGAIMGTPESIAWSQRNETVSVPAVCAACRRRVIADSMRDTYRNV